MKVPERYSPNLPASARLRLEHEARYGFAAALAAGRDVVDLGAGSGLGTLACLEAGAKSVVAVDKARDALEELRATLGSRSHVLEADVGSLPLEDGCADLVLLLEVIEHLEMPERAMAEARRLLRPEGILILSTPAREAGPNPHHRQLFSAQSLRRLLEGHFPQIRIFEQISFWGSAIVPTGKAGTPGLPETEPDYFVVLASPDELPDAPKGGGRFEPLESFEKGTLGRLSADLRHVEAERDALREELTATRNSLRWRVTGWVAKWWERPK